MQISIRQMFVFVLVFAVLLAGVRCALDFYSFVHNPFGGKIEFVDLNGSRAKKQLNDWPKTVAPGDVQLVSCTSESSRDSYSSWLRIKLTKKAAELWQNDVHIGRKPKNEDWSDDFYEGFEGVHRIIGGPPPLHWQTGETPVWWNPPSLDFRATEVMIWYKNYDSGIGQASYSGFDKTKNELWIYDHSSQHDILWSGGEIPDGDCFGNIQQDEASD